jgi:hypothetical protein
MRPVHRVRKTPAVPSPSTPRTGGQSAAPEFPLVVERQSGQDTRSLSVAQQCHGGPPRQDIWQPIREPFKCLVRVALNYAAVPHCWQKRLSKVPHGVIIESAETELGRFFRCL